MNSIILKSNLQIKNMNCDIMMHEDSLYQSPVLSEIKMFVMDFPPDFM